jgi:prepilin-type processing-associated H-X9-DG protein
VLGLLTVGITALFGLILGAISIVRINRSNGALRGFGIALAGTIVSGLFLLVLPIVAAMVLPALAQAKSKAQGIMCMNNMKQMALGVMIYANDHNDLFPGGENWCDAIQPYVGNNQAVFHCPGGRQGDQSHYGLNKRLSGMELKSVASPAQTVLLFESEGGWNVSGGPEAVIGAPRHRNTVGVAFADGHVEMVHTSRLQSLRWDP